MSPDSSMFIFRSCIHLSTERRMRGTHNPVRMNADKIPNAASIPKDLSTAMSLKTLAAKAAIVVIEVSMIARPTRCKVVCAASSGVKDFARSSLYLCNAWSESSMPSARTRIGSKFEN